MFEISLGIMAYNEEANIGHLLDAVIDQKFTNGHLNTIFVVASGCTDKTTDIVRTFLQKDERVRLLVQPHREGKASAINLFLSNAVGDIFILESGDTIPEKETLDRLVVPFEDDRVGMTGSHPVPVNSKNTFIGFCVNLMWDLHHKIALVTPKLGELVAFRSLVKEIPVNTAVDEASIESIIRKAGYELRYVPGAMVRNKGPENIKDFLKQRRRIAAGHKHLMIEEGYEVSTMDPKKILKILFQEHIMGFRNIFWTLGAVMVEIIGRGLGYYDFHVRKKNPFIWDIAASTKKLS